MGAHGHDWRGQTTHDEWRHHHPLSIFVCASCGAIWHPRSLVKWTSDCSGTGESHRQRYAEPKGSERQDKPQSGGKPTLFLSVPDWKPRSR